MMLRTVALASRGVQCRMLTTGADRIAFIGLGNMGRNMAANLMKKGKSVSVFDVAPAAAEAMKGVGATVAGSPAEAADGASVVITMVPSNPHVLEVYGGRGGVFETMQPNTMCIDCSTIDPAVSREVGADTVAKGGRFLDAPVSGGVTGIGAAAGTLSFMVGGTKEDFAEAEPLLRLMGTNVFYCGPVGSGEVVKLCNNLMLGISMLGASEVMNLGVQQGVDAKLLASIINVSTGRCWSTEAYNPVPGVVEGVPASNNYVGGFGSALMNKDLGLALDAAGASESATPLGSIAKQIYQELTDNPEYATKDFSVAYKYLQEISGKQ